MLEWELDVPLLEVPPTHIEENYTSVYSVDTDGVAGNDLALRLHPNGLCIIALAPSHAALQGSGSDGAGTQPAAAADHSQTAQHVDLQRSSSGNACNREQLGALSPATDGQEQQQQPQQPQQAATGTGGAAQPHLALPQKLLQAEFRKGRGPLLQADTILGRLVDGGTTYTLRCCCRGLLVELNSRLADLQGDELLRALANGYLAILDLRAAEAAQLKERCLSEGQYRQRGNVGVAAA